MYEIMCFGDSLTWGTIAKWHENDPSRRYDRDTRWPCVLQKELGEGFAVKEEGLPGRASIYTANPEFPYKNGLHMIEGCLATDKPLDLVILMIGTNDLHMNEKLPEDKLGEGVSVLIDTIRKHPETGPDTKRPPEILIIAPPVVVPSCPQGRTEVYPRFFGDYGGNLSRRFPEVYSRIAKEKGCYYLNGQDYIEPDIADGVHITAESHLRLGKAVALKVKEIYVDGRIHDRS